MQVSHTVKMYPHEATIHGSHATAGVTLVLPYMVIEAMVLGCLLKVPIRGEYFMNTAHL